MNVVVIIPARMRATRLAGKPMLEIAGMPMIEHCFHRARLAVGTEAVYVATCDKVIENHISQLGGKTIMTGEHHKRATTRTSEALEIIEKKEKKKIDVIVMLQGDEPFIASSTIAEMQRHFVEHDVEVVNVMSKIESQKTFEDRNNVKVTVKENMDALYFSRSPIPSRWQLDVPIPMYLQTGVIAFRRQALLAFNAMPETALEVAESIDMNRLLENNKNVKMVLSSKVTFGVDTHDDLKLANQKMPDDHDYKLYCNS